MSRFVMIGYGDRGGYERAPAAVRTAAHTHDAKLVAHGALIGTAGRPVQVRNADAVQVETTNGPFMSASLPVAGFSIIEAENLGAAIALATRMPCAVAHGVVEVWPLELPS